MKIKKIFLSLLVVLLSVTALPTTVNAAKQWGGTSAVLNKNLNVNINGLGSTNIYRLKVNGYDAFCTEKNKIMEGNLFLSQRNDKMWEVNEASRRVLAWYESNDASKRVINREQTYWIAQIAVWGLEEGVVKGTAEELGPFTIKTAIEIGYLTGLSYYLAQDLVDHCSALSKAEGLAMDGRTYLGHSMLKYKPVGNAYYFNDNYQLLISIAPPTYYETPDYAKVSASSSVTETVNVNVTKSDASSNAKMEGVTFDFYRDGVKFATSKTNADGLATATFTKDYSSSKEYTYCSNYSSLNQSYKNQANQHTASLNGGKSFTSYNSALEAAKADAQAVANADANKAHNYYAIETATRKYYFLDPNNSKTNELTGVNGNTVELSLSNKRIKSVVNLVKKDATTNTSVPQGTEASLDGAIYGLYARENILDPATGAIMYAKDALIDKVTIKDGKAGLTLDFVGAMYWKEEVPPVGYNLNPEVINIDTRTDSNSVTEVTLTNDAKENVITGKITVYKRDIENNKQVLLPNFTFDVFNNKNEKVTTIKTNDQGIAEAELVYGHYTVKEVSANGDYLLDTNTTHNIFIDKQGEIEIVNFSDMRIKGDLTITKLDSETSANPQGDATLTGAKYGLYAKTDIMSPWDNNEVLYPANTLVKTLITNENGIGHTDEIFMGQYYLKEIEAPKGYNPDPQSYDVTFTKVNQSQSIIVREKTLTDDIIFGHMELLKVSTDGDNTEEIPPEEGAEFIVMLTKYVDQYGSCEEAYKHISEFSPREYDYITTDASGKAKTKDLAYGDYTYVQVKGQPNLTMMEKPGHFTINDQDQVISKIVNNKPFEAYLKIGKRDLETNKLITFSNASFELYKINPDGSRTKVVMYDNTAQADVSVFKTNEKGYAGLPKMLDFGKYYVTEVASPNGFILSPDGIEFEIGSQSDYEVNSEGNPVIEVSYLDERIYGQIEILKTGNTLVSKTTANGNTQFVYENKPLKNMTAEVRAAENILNPVDGSVIYNKGDLVATLITDENGKAITDKLPLGKYQVTETIAPNGNIANEKNTYLATLSEGNKTETLVFDRDTHFDNERQKVELDFTKVDKESKKPIQGAKFALYSHNDIYGYDGNLLMAKDTAIETVISDANGKISFKADLPNGSYYVKELEQAPGYVSNNKVYEIDALYKGQDVPVIKVSQIVENEITKTHFIKQYATDGKPLQNAKVQVKDKATGAIIDSWTTTTDWHEIKGLVVGKTYIFEEVEAPLGFKKAQPVEITIEDTSAVQFAEPLKDEFILGNLSFIKEANEYKQFIENKEDGFDKYDTLKAEFEKILLAGAQIGIFAKEDITLGDGVTYYKKGDLVETITTKADAAALSKDLYVGKYYYQELDTVPGFIVDRTPHDFEIVNDETLDTQVIEGTLLNEHPSIDLVFNKVIEELKHNKEDSCTEDVYKDVLYGIYAKEDIILNVNDIEKELIKAGTLVYVSGITKEGKLNISGDIKLPEGKYFIKELETNENYIMDKKEYEFTVEYGKNTQVENIDVLLPNMFNEHKRYGEVSIHKHGDISKFTNPQGIDEWFSNKYPRYQDGPLEGVEFTLYAGEDMTWYDGTTYKRGDVVSKGLTDKDGNLTFEMLELGKYYFKETKTLDDYLPNIYEYDFEITKLGTVWYDDNHKFDIENEHKHYGGVDIIKRGEKFVIDPELNKEPENNIGNLFGLIQDNNTYPKFERIPLEGVKFSVHAANDMVLYDGIEIKKDDVIKTGYTDEEGKLSFEMLEVGKYYLSETNNDENYVPNIKTYPFEIKKQEDSWYDHTIEPFEIDNDLRKGFIEVSKEDSETGKDTQGKGTLKGTEFTIFNSDTNEIVEVLVTDEKGFAKSHALPAGMNFKVQETKAPEGYELGEALPLEGTVEEDKTLLFEFENDIIDEDVVLEKVNAKGELLNGALFEVWETDPTDVKNTEKQTLLGYYITGGIYLKVDAKAEVLIADNPEMEKAETKKADVNGILEINNLKDGVYYTQVKGSDIVVKHIVKKGTIIIEDRPYLDTLKFKEVRAPKGYYLEENSECYYEAIPGKAEYQFKNNKIIIIEIPDTGVKIEIHKSVEELILYSTIAIASIGIAVYAIRKNNKKNSEE